jgi:hypothetical protein
MQYSNSLIGTWAVCRVASRVEALWKRTYAIGTASLASSGKLLPSRACLKADGGLSHVPKVIKKGPRTCGRSVLGWNQEKHGGIHGHPFIIVILSLICRLTILSLIQISL